MTFLQGNKNDGGRNLTFLSRFRPPSFVLAITQPTEFPSACKLCLKLHSSLRITRLLQGDTQTTARRSRNFGVRKTTVQIYQNQPIMAMAQLTSI